MKKKIRFLAAALFALALFVLPLSAAEEGAETGETFTGQMTDFFVTHSTEVFSGLALAGTGVLAFFYRRGLLPVLSGGLTSLSHGVESMTESARNAIAESDARLSDFTAKTEPLLKQIAAVGEYLDRLGEKLAELEAAAAGTADERERLRVLSEASVDMLKEVFTAAKLPVSSKVELEEIYRRTKEASA